MSVAFVAYYKNGARFVTERVSFIPCHETPSSSYRLFYPENYDEIAEGRRKFLEGMPRQNWLTDPNGWPS